MAMSESSPSSSSLECILTGQTLAQVLSSESSTNSGPLACEESFDVETVSSQSTLILHPWVSIPSQEILSNKANFQNASSIDILTAGENGTIWMSEASDRCIEALLADTAPGCKPPYSLVVFFISLCQEEEASYFRQANIARQSLRALIEQFNINEAAVPNILGRPDYWSSFGVAKDIEKDTGGGYEFYCQHPRWLQKTRHDTGRHKAPCSVYLHHNQIQKTSYYVISTSKDDGFSAEIRRRFTHSEKVALGAMNPFMIHALISGLVFEQSKEYLKDVQDRLFSQIAQVNDYSKGSNYTGFEKSSRVDGRRQLEGITKQLHLVSQTCDSGIANAAMSIKLSEEMLNAYDRFVESPINAPASWRQTRESMVWIMKTWQCQTNWLVSYKARKDTAMNFVFNLVTQQDNSTNIDIAVQGARYSSSMNMITVLTMIFLPGTFLAGLFGSGILDNTNTHGISDIFWPFIAAIIPLTILTMFPWFWRQRLERGLQRTKKAIIRSGKTMSRFGQARIKEKDEEVGNMG